MSNNNGNVVDDQEVVTMVQCNDCGHMVPEANLAIHQATACGARARRQPPSPSLEEPLEPSSPPTTTTTTTTLGIRQRRPWSTPTRPTTRIRSPIVVPCDDEMTPPPITEETLNNDNPKRSDDSSSVVDLTTTPTNDSRQQQQQEWACPRCTLLNPHNQERCGACGHVNQDIVRAPDAVRTEQLIHNIDQQEEGYAHLQGAATNGAILGSMLGAVNAYMGGRSIGSGALEGAMTGLVGGAIAGEYARQATSSNSSDVALARSGASMGGPTYPSMTTATSTSSTTRRGGGRMQPRSSFRVVQTSNGGVQTTVYSRGGSSSITSPHHHHHHHQMDDPFLNLMMQSLMTPRRRRGSVDGMSYEELLQAFGDGTEHLGADEGTIQSLPVATVQDVSKELPQDQKQCCICLEDFKTGDKRKTLPCLHGFHQECVDKWLRSNGSCPVCKYSISQRHE